MSFSCTARSAKTKLFWLYRNSIAYAPAFSLDTHQHLCWPFGSEIGQVLFNRSLELGMFGMRSEIVRVEKILHSGLK